MDINEEAIEIAKLSLWIRTAEKGRKLSDLNNNLKCGNSLIDDPAVAGDKAFDWNKEFPEIMDNGGFDVVIGNPPYISYYGRFKNSLSKNDERFIKKRYFFIGDINKQIDFNQVKGKFNSTMFFIEKCFNISKDTVALIVDLNFSKPPFRDIRKYLSNNAKIREIVLDVKGWGEVGSGQIILTYDKSYTRGNKLRLRKGLEDEQHNNINQTEIVNFFEGEGNPKVQQILSKVNNKSNKVLANWYPKKLIRTSINFIAQKDRFICSKDNPSAKPLAEGSDSLNSRYCIPQIKTHIIYHYCPVIS